MLILAIGAVVVGAVFLVLSFITETTAWAWGCIAACGVAAVVLVSDTIRRSRARHAREPNAAAGEPLVGADADQVIQPETSPAQTTPAQTTPADAAPAETAPLAPGVQEAAQVAGPDEEDVEAADVLTVGSLTTGVLVVDEQPRFHLSSCPWLAEKPTIPLAVGEAMELGFTGCAQCQPVASLAARSRTG